MLGISRAYAPSSYGQLHYRIALPTGPVTSPPLLCLHQTPSSGHEWEPVMVELAVGRVVIAADTPGYGVSDAPPAPVTIEAFADVMLGFIDHLTATGVITAGLIDVVGAHTGSIIATELAARSPSRVRKAVLFGLAAYDAATRAKKLAGLRDKFPVPGDDLTHIEKLWAIFGQLSDPRMTAEERHIAMAQCLCLGTRMPWAYEAVYRYDFLDAMTRVEQPTLIINPDDDLSAVTRAMSGRYINGRRMDLPGVKHGVLKLEKERLVKAIDRFLDAP